MKTAKHRAVLLLTQLTRSAILSGLISMFLLFWINQLSAQEDPAKLNHQSQQRLELMKSRSVDASLTILPVRLMGTPYDRVSELLGVLLEQQGLKNIGIDRTAFNPETKNKPEMLAESVGRYVKSHDFPTEYVMYAEMNGNNENHGIGELVTVVVDKNGALVWAETLDSKDEAFRLVEDPDPMGYSMLMVQRLCPQMGLNEETARNAKPGKMSALMDERSGLPPQSERDLMPERQKQLKDNIKNSSLLVFPVRVDGKENELGAELIVSKLHASGLNTVKASADKPSMKSPREDPNELKKLWDLAREFREYVKKNSPDADYLLYADYGMPGYVHFIVCNRMGDWVLTDLQNSDHPDFRAFNTATADGCSGLVVSRFLKYLKTPVTEELRKTINETGVESGMARFHELKANTDDYTLSEEEMNALGYEFLMAKKVKEAIGVFRMNVEAFPDSWNVYDSLGEAYAANGETELAIANYEKSLKLNPGSPSGKEALKKLKGKKE